MNIETAVAALVILTLLPFYIHICVKVAAQTWMEEVRRYEQKFFNGE